MSRGVKERGHPIIGAKESGMEGAATVGGKVFRPLEGHGWYGVAAQAVRNFRRGSAYCITMDPGMIASGSYASDAARIRRIVLAESIQEP